MAKRRYPAASLTADLFVEILARLPVRSVCSSKCVSRAWRDLISHPDHLSKLPQTLAGFFYKSTSGERFPISALHFNNVSGRGPPLIFPSFSFLPKHQHIVLHDCCNGLLLCRCCSGEDDYHYYVCNPATKKWVAVPDSNQTSKICTARLGFDPAVSPHFHVLEFLEEDHEDLLVTGVEVYSSETGGWVHTENDGWNNDIILVDDGLSSSTTTAVFLNGFLHCLTFEHDVAVVDMEGKTLRSIAVPDDPPCLDLGFIQQSQGRLHYANFERHDDVLRLVIYVLEDYDSQEWVLKHSAKVSDVLGQSSFNLICDFQWVAIHPECNLIFYTVGWDKTLKSYDMDHQRVRVIRILGHDSQPEYLPYVPLYSELQALLM